MYAKQEIKNHMSFLGYEVLDLDETPAYGLETKLKIGIKGVIECI